MTERNRLIVDAMYVSWEGRDIPAMLNCFSDNVAFAVHPPTTSTFLGQGRGKTLLKRRLEMFLADYAVMNFLTSSSSSRGDWVDCRVTYHYRHKKTRMEIDGSMRHLWLMQRGKIVRFEVIHDARRMGAFFELAAQFGVQ